MIYKNKIKTMRHLCFLWIFIGLSVTLMAQSKQDKKVFTTNINLTVTDESGNLLKDANIVVGEGERYAHSNQSGVISFDAQQSDFVMVSSVGYEDATVLAQNIYGVSTLKLKKKKLFSSKDDIISLPFIDLKKRNITGSTIVLTGEQLEKYQGTDIRNAFTGLAAGLEVREIAGTPGVNVVENYGGTEKIDVLLRGRSPMYLVDGMPTDMTEMPLDPSEIESATIIKDIVAKAMYGPAGADGIISIKTKRGKSNERNIHVNFEKGVNIADRMPTWSNGSDYAQLNNLARANSGLPTLYSDNAIAKYAVNDGYDMYHPNNNFRDMMFRNTTQYTRANVSSSGGNDVVRYFSYLGYTGEGDMFKIGSSANYSRIMSRSNLDIKINNFVKVKFGIYGAISLRNSPNYGDGTAYSTFDNAWIEANLTAPVAFPVYANNSPLLDKPWYGVTSTFPSNPIGGLVGKGFFNDQGRSGASNIALDYDMSHLVKGLSSETYVGFNIFNQVRKGKAENYTAYIATPSLTPAGADTILLTKAHDGVDQADLSKLTDYYYQRFAVYETLKHEMNVGDANVINALTYYATKVTRDGYEDSQRQQNFSWSGILNFKDKYSLEAVANYAGTYSFAKDKRYEIFPSLGAGWIISEESFMKSIRVVNYLKLRAEVGILGYDNFQAPFYDRDNYSSNNTGQAFGPYATGTWFGTNTETGVNRTTPSRIGNPDLGWEKRKEVTVGLDALLFSGKLSVEANYYNNLRDGIISQVSSIIPNVVGISATLPKYNFNSINYSGFEVALKYSDHIGNFKYSLGGNATIQDSKYVKVDEPAYKFAYQSHLGQPIDGIYGLKSIGKFQSDAEALVVPQLFDDVLHAGDLKYKDMNGDGVIDDNDRTLIGRSSPKLYYSLNIDLKYKAFELSILGTGRAFYDIALSNSYFWNGWGDNNYSSFVRNNLGGAYPRLTYNKVNNNFTGSDFWLTKGDFFKIQNVVLSFNVPENWIKSVGIRRACIYVKGTNLYTLSSVKDVDPESINSGVNAYPLFINLTGGFKLTF